MERTEQLPALKFSFSLAICYFLYHLFKAKKKNRKITSLSNVHGGTEEDFTLIEQFSLRESSLDTFRKNTFWPLGCCDMAFIVSIASNCKFVSLSFLSFLIFDLFSCLFVNFYFFCFSFLRVKGDCNVKN